MQAVDSTTYVVVGTEVTSLEVVVGSTVVVVSAIEDKVEVEDGSIEAEVEDGSMEAEAGGGVTNQEE